jgi:hypothetical protein
LNDFVSRWGITESLLERDKLDAFQSARPYIGGLMIVSLQVDGEAEAGDPLGYSDAHGHYLSFAHPNPDMSTGEFLEFPTDAEGFEALQTNLFKS